MTATAPAQLPLVAPGWCANGCGCRLSIANTDGVCDGCTDDATRHTLPVPVPGLCTKCRVSQRQPGDTFCAPCRSDANHEAYLRRQKQYASAKRARRQPDASPDGARVSGGGRG